MQGYLRNEALSVTIDTVCAHCGQALHLTVDSALNWSIQEDTTPLLFEPEIDWGQFTEATIIDDY